MRYTLFAIAGVAALSFAFAPAASAQLVIGKEPGIEVKEVTAGPGWKTCPRCQNNGHIKAAKEKYKVEGHAFNPKDFSGVWGNNGIPFVFKTKPPFTEYGIKGMGEGGAVAPPAAIANAVRDALAATGAEVNETPITPRRVLAAIRKARET